MSTMTLWQTTSTLFFAVVARQRSKETLYSERDIRAALTTSGRYQYLPSRLRRLYS